MKKRIAFLLAIILFFTCMPWSATPAAAAPEEKSPADDCKILDYVHEDVFEKADHLGRMEEEETLSNYVFLNKDGTRTAYYLDEAVKFVDTDGKIKEKDITLQSVLGGYATTQNDVTVTLPITMSSGVNLSYNNHQISLIPEGGTAGAPRIVNNAAEYVDFYGADTVLKYTPTLSGVKEDIILESYTGQNTFTFILNTNGLAVYHTKEDRYYLAPGKGTDPVYWLGALEIYDSALNMGTGTMTVEPMMAGQKYKITITVDTSWLTSAKTVYPVTVDPSITVNTNSGSNYIEDAPIYSGSSAIKGRNYGSNIYNCAGYMDSTYGMGRTVVRLTGLMNDSTFQSIPASAITSAKFRTYDAAGSAKTTVDLYPLTTTVAWTESNVTWNNIDGDTNSNDDDYYFTAAAYASKKFGYGSYADFDITVLVQKWKTGAFNSNYSFILIGTNESTKRGLYSSEHSTTAKRPYVEVTYESSVLYSSFSTAQYFNNTLERTIENDEVPSADGTDVYYDDGLQYRSNCYGYALRIYYSGQNLENNMTHIYSDDSKSYYAYKQQPGEFVDKEFGLPIKKYGATTNIDIIYSRSELNDFYDNVIFNGQAYSSSERMYYLTQLLIADIEEMGYTIREYTGEAIPSYNAGVVDESGRPMRLIALVLNGYDYHFYMQHSDADSAGNNYWSHKQGERPPTNRCILHKEILTNANIMDHVRDTYNDGVRFFYISKGIEDCGHSVNGYHLSCYKTSLD